MIPATQYTVDSLLGMLKAGEKQLRHFVKKSTSSQPDSSEIANGLQILLHSTIPEHSCHTAFGMDMMEQVTRNQNPTEYDQVFSFLSNPQISKLRHALKSVRFWLNGFFNSNWKLAASASQLRKPVKECPKLAYKILDLYKRLIDINVGADMIISSKLTKWLDNNKNLQETE